MLRSTGFTWKERPICGNAVAMIVPSRFSMKNAAATRMAMDVDLVEGSGSSLIISGSIPIANDNVTSLRNSRRYKLRRMNLTFNTFRRDGVSSRQPLRAAACEGVVYREFLGGAHEVVSFMVSRDGGRPGACRNTVGTASARQDWRRSGT